MSELNWGDDSPEVGTEDQTNSSESGFSALLCVGFSKEQDSAIKEAVANWDFNKVQKRASEELLELSLALLHYGREKATLTDVLNEMADVRIVLRHLEIRFGTYQKQLNDKVIKCDT